MDPIRVGFCGLDQEASFHLDRFRLREDFQVVSAACHDPKLADVFDSLKIPLVSFDQLLSSSIDLLVMSRDCGLNHSKLNNVIESGRSLLLSIPIRLSDRNWVSGWASSATRSTNLKSGKVFVFTPHRWESAFLTVSHVVKSGVLGEINYLHRISRQFVPPLDSSGGVSPSGSILHQQPDRRTHVADTLTSQPGEISSPTQDVLHHMMLRHWFEMLDELLSLVDTELTLVNAKAFRQIGGTSELIDVGRAAEFRMANGGIAELELHRLALVPIETGWIIEGSNSGYGNSKRYRSVADGELVDAPIETIKTDQDAFYQSLHDTIRMNAEFPVQLESIQRTCSMFDAIELICNG